MDNVKIIFLLVLSFFLNDVCTAQIYSIEGIVTDTTDNPLIGVNIVLIGTGYGVSTDKSGKFEIPNLVPGNYALEFSAIGYEKKSKKRNL